MRPLAFSTNKILFLALLLSAGFHFFVSRFVVIELTSMRESDKPSLVFRGSFLRSLTTPQKIQGGEALPSLPSSGWKEFENSPYNRAKLIKPQSQESYSFLPKETEKPAIVTNPDEATGQPIVEDIGIDVESRPYQPLRFQTQ